MSRKTIAARREAFFRALAQTGNQTIAAERAKVSRSWIQLNRSADAAFDARCVAALAQARARLEAGTRMAPAESWGTLDGEELVVRRGRGLRTQIARARAGIGWSPRVETRFLATLARTCNVKASCAAAGVSKTAAYAHRKRWQAFARRWDAAVEEGGMRLETALIQRACNLFSPDEQPLDEDGERLPPMTVAETLSLLRLYRHRLHGVGKPRTPWRRPRTLDEVRDSILRKLEAIGNAERLGEAALAADEAHWAKRRAG